MRKLHLLDEFTTPSLPLPPMPRRQRGRHARGVVLGLLLVAAVVLASGRLWLGCKEARGDGQGNACTARCELDVAACYSSCAKYPTGTEKYYNCRDACEYRERKCKGRCP